MIRRIFFAALLLCAQVSASTILYSNGTVDSNAPGVLGANFGPALWNSTNGGGAVTGFNLNGAQFTITGFEFTLVTSTQNQGLDNINWSINSNPTSGALIAGSSAATTQTFLGQNPDHPGNYLWDEVFVLPSPLIINPSCNDSGCQGTYFLELINALDGAAQQSFNPLWAQATSGSLQGGLQVRKPVGWQTSSLYPNGVIFDIQGTAGSAPPADTPEALTFLTVGSGLLCLGIRFRWKKAKGKGDPALALQIAASNHDRSPAGLGVVFSRV